MTDLVFDGAVHSNGGLVFDNVVFEVAEVRERLVRNTSRKTKLKNWFEQDDEIIMLVIREFLEMVANG